MDYKLVLHCYHKYFKQPLKTNCGIWEFREGIIIELTDELGNARYGEIAPIPWFGSETLQEAKEFCNKLSDRITDTTISNVPGNLPACQFAFESAIEDLPENRKIELSNSQLAGLLPAGVAALSTWENLWKLGYRTFKWKIAVGSCQEELDIFQQLVRLIPPSAKLRLDANGGLDRQEAIDWLEMTEGTQVEFLEQPLPVSEFEAMHELSIKYQTPIALDESVATITQLRSCCDRGWQGIFIIKPAIAGSPRQLRQLFQTYQIDAVFSSVFETSIGRQAALKLAVELSNPQRALGFGVEHWI